MGKFYATSEENAMSREDTTSEVDTSNEKEPRTKRILRMKEVANTNRQSGFSGTFGVVKRIFGNFSS